MKKTIKSLLAIAITALAFTACSDVPAPYDMPGTGGGGGISGGTGTGQVDDPYNIAAAIAKCKEIGGTESTEKYYVKGIVVTAGTADETYGNVSFDMADDATSTAKFKAFQVLGSDAKKLPAGYAVNKGDEVIVYGPMYNYNGKTPETAGKGAAFIYSINGKKTDGSDVTPPAPSVEPKGTGTKDDPFNIAAAIKKCQEIGQTESSEKYYVKGLAAADASPDATYGNASIDMIDKEGSTDVFKAFQVLGTDGKKMPTTYKIAKGAEVVVYGPIYNYMGNTPETAGKGAAYIVTVNGQPTEVEGGGGSSDPGEAKGSGTLADPYNIAAIIKFTQELAADAESTEDVYFKGKISQVKNKYVADDYGNATFYVSEDGTTNNEFYCFRTLYLGNTKFAGGTKNIKVGDEVVICGKVVNYKGNTPETVSNKSYLYSLNGKTEAEADEGGEGGGSGEAASELTNLSFEEWTDGAPTGWSSKATNTTIEQNTDARTGSYSVLVKGNDTANKRFASQEIALTAGTYEFSFYAKAATTEVSQARAGWVTYKDGAPDSGSYKYGSFIDLNANDWTLVSFEFTLSADASISVVCMNPKKNDGKTSAKEILVDDAKLVKK